MPLTIRTENHILIAAGEDTQKGRIPMSGIWIVDKEGTAPAEKGRVPVFLLDHLKKLDIHTPKTHGKPGVWFPQHTLDEMLIHLDVVLLTTPTTLKAYEHASKLKDLISSYT